MNKNRSTLDVHEPVNALPQLARQEARSTVKYTNTPYPGITDVLSLSNVNSLIQMYNHADTTISKKYDNSEIFSKYRTEAQTKRQASKMAKSSERIPITAKVVVLKKIDKVPKTQLTYKMKLLPNES